ncbi:amidohydrolase [Falsiruegeria mediterranea]|uniref:N-substituted formamide deformylase n=1 Tax=Falsiruegeria mediterranea M17 TaxID=1200281 RepID=A0A2R8CDP4_9RHOB|nr:amidohydrolase [Falsiruegeria mediterranea]SPJ30479.1 N-substituted formamide deformylase [Falsiruegeria mediterranea M17]
MSPTPDLIILNGSLLTFDDATPRATALAIQDGTIVAVGDTDDIRSQAGNGTKIIDAAGGTVMPGFIDSHVHLFGGAAELGMLDLRETVGADALTKALRTYAAEHPDEPLLMGVAADYEILGPGVKTTRQDLDRILSERPVALMSADHHTVWANTIALQKAGILNGAVVPPGSEIVMAGDGTAQGQLNETGAFGPVLRLSQLGGRDLLGYVTGADPEPPATPKERAFDKEVILRGLNHCASHGITGLHNMDGNFYQLELLSELEAEGRLPIRVQVPMHLKNTDSLDRLEEADEMRRRFTSDMVWSGRVKMFMDGVLDSYTALMLAPYPGKPDSLGDAVFSAEHFNEACIRADAMGLQLSTHAIGDGAVRRTLDGYEAARNANGARDSRHRIEHIELIDPLDLPRLAGLDVVASLQPLHSPAGGLFSPYPAGDILTAEQIPFAFAWNKIRESGAKICFSTDWPVVPVDTMMTVAGAVNCTELPSPWQDNRQSLTATLSAYSHDNAWIEFNEHRKGRLRPGYMADIAILEQDLFSIDEDQLANARVATTICRGVVSHGS